MMIYNQVHLTMKLMVILIKRLMMMMMMMNYFCGMVDRWKTFSLISSQDHCQRSSSSGISDTPRQRFETAQNLSSGLVEWSCAVVTTTTPRSHIFDNESDNDESKKSDNESDNDSNNEPSYQFVNEFQN